MLNVRMKGLRQFGVLVLLLVTSLAPAMACMVPGVQMSAQERACCRMMSTQCSHTEMPASRGCCQKAPASLYDTALGTKAVAFHPVVVRVIWLAASEFANPVSAVIAWIERPDYTPPKSPPSIVSSLRI
jgi:hypothetical protein